MKGFLLCVFMVFLLAARINTVIVDLKKQDIIDDEWDKRR